MSVSSSAPIKSPVGSLGRHSAACLSILWRQRITMALGVLALIVVDIIQLEALLPNGLAVNVIEEGGDIWGPVWALIAIGAAIAALRWAWRVTLWVLRGGSVDCGPVFDQVLDLGSEARGRFHREIPAPPAMWRRWAWPVALGCWLPPMHW